MERSKSILKQLIDVGMPDTTELSEHIKSEVRTYEVTTYHGLPCGPNILDSEEIIVVEGRADVVNLLKYGIKNCIAVNGTSIPQQVIDLAKEKTVTLFVDGDRGGQLIFRELTQKTDIDFVAQAPEGKEVEDLTQKEVYKALREKVPASQFKAEIMGKNNSISKSAEKRGEKKEFRSETIERKFQIVKYRPTDQEKEIFRQILDDLVGSRAAIILDETLGLMGKVPIAELTNTLRNIEKPYAVVLDGKIDYDINNIAEMRGIRFVVGTDKEQNMKTRMCVLTRAELEGNA